MGVALVVVLGLGIALSLYQLSHTEPLMAQANALPAGDTRLVRQKEVLQFEADNLAKIWTTMVQAIVGVVLAAGAVATWRNLRVAQEGQITNRFTQAIDQLGAVKDKAPNLEVRLGAIYALERIATDSPRDHWTIMEVLTSYVRQNAPWPPRLDARPSISPWRANKATAVVKPRTDIQAVLTVLGRCMPPPEWKEPGRLDLTGTDLRGANLTMANLSEADLTKVNLTGADLDRASLANADLSEAEVTAANLSSADLTNAKLTAAKLTKANLTSANLTGAILERANLDGANLWAATITKARLVDAHLIGADLRRARLVEARLGEADLTHARLVNANLTEADLTEADLSEAILGRLHWTGDRLEGADLVRADLTKANLTGARLEGVDLSGAFLYGANLDRADLGHTGNLTVDQVTSAASREGALLPPEIVEALGESTPETLTIPPSASVPADS